jgi:hypothetical protein
MSASDNKITRMSQGPRVARVGLTVALLTVLLVGGGCTVTAQSAGRITGAGGGTAAITAAAALARGTAGTAVAAVTAQSGPGPGHLRSTTAAAGAAVAATIAAQGALPARRIAVGGGSCADGHHAAVAHAVVARLNHDV